MAMGVSGFSLGESVGVSGFSGESVGLSGFSGESVGLSGFSGESVGLCGLSGEPVGLSRLSTNSEDHTRRDLQVRDLLLNQQVKRKYTYVYFSSREAKS